MYRLRKAKYICQSLASLDVYENDITMTVQSKCSNEIDGQVVRSPFCGTNTSPLTSRLSLLSVVNEVTGLCVEVAHKRANRCRPMPELQRSKFLGHSCQEK